MGRSRPVAVGVSVVMDVPVLVDVTVRLGMPWIYVIL